ncbi:MAG: DNA repair and recombination protein RadA, partial [Deltaproteobacteria bacterium CG_4_9_14_3_um_filter_63_12]
AIVIEMSEDTALKVITAARKRVEASFETGNAIMEQRLKIEKITTGS